MNGKASIWSLSFLALFFCTAIAAVLVLFYLYIIRPYVFLPADILSFAETNFVGDMIKLRIGAPLYTPPQDSNSLVYSPGAQLLTYALAWVLGKDASIPAWRMIQLGFIASAALLATACCGLLRKLIGNDEQTPFRKTWLVFTFLTLFLAATAPRVNPFAHTLQSDALSLLVSMLCFWALLLYLRNSDWRHVILMAVCPALGYLTKQNLMSWAVLMFAALALRDHRNYRHLLLFASCASVSIGAAIGTCYLLWGDDFVFWTFEILEGRNAITLSPSSLQISLPRSVNHTILAWMEIAIGVVGSLAIFERCQVRKFVPVFAAWVLLIGVEGLASGSNWGTLYHFGPGVVTGCVLLLAVLPILWPYASAKAESDRARYIYDRAKPLVFATGVMTLFVALHVVPTGDRREARYWQPQPLADVYRYIDDIEREFEGLPPDEVLLDIGNWVYLPHSVLAKDRAVSLADQPPAGIYENIHLTAARIENRVYKKIMVRDLHSPFFYYDWYSWERPSGVRRAIAEHYDEIRTIPAVEGNTLPINERMQAGPVSVLVPKSGT